jgi:protein TonB
MGTRAATGLFGPYVAAPPRDLVRPEAEGRRPARGPAAPSVPPDDLRLETGVVSGSAAVGHRRWLTTSCSFVIHAVGLAATLALPLVLSSGLPEPARAVQVFLVVPLALPPPPPPPAPVPRPAGARTTPDVRPAEPVGFMAPIEVPTGLQPEDGLDLGIAGGVAGGVEGGVPGGVVGAIVGGLSDSLAAKPPPRRPLRVSGLVREPVKIKHVAPVYPPVAVAGKIEGSVSLEALVDVTGHVTDVKVLEGNPLFEEAAIEAALQWVYTPTLLDGVPVPLILTITVQFQLAD